MIALGAFVLRNACQQLRRLRDAGHDALTMAINVSHIQLRDPDFMMLLKASLDEAGVPGSQVELEITESMAAEDLELVRGLLAALKTLGVRVAIDDFGTGFSSLSVLRHLDAQRLKIDRSFVTEMLQDNSIARMVISLGHKQRMEVTAEGIETEAQRDALLALGCDEDRAGCTRGRWKRPHCSPGSQTRPPEPLPVAPLCPGSEAARPGMSPSASRRTVVIRRQLRIAHVIDQVLDLLRRRTRGQADQHDRQETERHAKHPR